MKKITGVLGIFIILHAQAQQLINPQLLNGLWKARWISCSGIAQRAYGVYHFRKVLHIEKKPQQFIIHVSADNRYRLFVNEKMVSAGPARCDLNHWNFETVDIAAQLHEGDNIIAAQVWNMAEYAAVPQMSNQTGFLLQGDGDAEQILNTNNSWKACKDSAYTPCSLENGAKLRTYMVIGPGDKVDASAYPWGWQTRNFDDSKWQQAVVVTGAQPEGYGTDNLWTLAPRSIPQMEESLQRIVSVRRKSGIEDAGFIAGNHPVTIPANATVSILLDQTFNTVAYPELNVSGGKGSAVKLTYAEALFDTNHIKGNRNEIEGKSIAGNYDIFLPDGGHNRLFRPLWFRTFRYLQLDITTGNEPLTIEDLYGQYTGYPFVQKASFSSNDPSLKNIWDVGWRTARLCAGENYFDCPYYEQLQYAADTRIQCLISLYITGDDRLMRKAIVDFHNSQVPEGLTQSRYPSSRFQIIPTFSLFWISMIHDYWMLRRDDAFIEDKLQAVRAVLGWHEKKIAAGKQMLGPMKWWNFVDWNNSFPGGVPDGATDGNSSIISLQYASTLKQASGLFNYFGKKEEAAHYESLASALIKNTYRYCFDATKNAMANTPLKNTFSQHASIMAILTGSIPQHDMQKVLQTILTDKSLSQATFYYRFYLTRAMKAAGMSNSYYSNLKPWRDMLANGLTTFAENPDPTRSDCHAWSASPVYDFLATICGIEPAAPGFKKINIAPAPGELTSIKGTMPHPDGTIAVDLQRKGANGIEGTIVLPANTSGTFNWNGKTLALKPGEQHVQIL